MLNPGYNINRTCKKEKNKFYVTENRRILFNQNNYPKLSAQISDIVVDKNGHIWASIFENNLVSIAAYILQDTKLQTF